MFGFMSRRAAAALVLGLAAATAPGVAAAQSFELIDDGRYAAVLARWNLTAEAVDRSRTNPPGLPRF